MHRHLSEHESTRRDRLDHQLQELHNLLRRCAPARRRISLCLSCSSLGDRCFHAVPFDSCSCVLCTCRLLVRIGPSRGPAVRVGVGRRVPRDHQSGAHNVLSPILFSFHFLFSFFLFFSSFFPLSSSSLLMSTGHDTLSASGSAQLCLRYYLLFFLNPLAVRSAAGALHRAHDVAV